MAPRIPPAHERSLPDEIKKLLANALTGFKRFPEPGGAILFKGEFDARKREIAMLHVAHVTRDVKLGDDALAQIIEC